MDCPLIREYLNLVDENGANKGVVTPCDLFAHLTEGGMEHTKALLLAGTLPVLGGLATNPSLPLYTKTDGPEREGVAIPRVLNPMDVISQGGQGLFQHVVSIGEALVIPHLSQTLTRQPVGAVVRGKKVKKRKGLLKTLDAVVQHKDLIGSILKPVMKSMLK